MVDTKDDSSTIENKIEPTEKNQYKLITSEMLQFQPTDKEIFIRGSKPEIFLRCIYTNMELYPKEQEAMDGFKKYLEDESLQIDPCFWTFERKVLRYLQAFSYDFKQAFDSIKLYEEWYASFDQVIQPQQLEMLNEGAIYMLRRDKQHRPVHYYNVNVMKTYTPEKLLQMPECVVHMLNFCQNHCLVPAHVEQWLLVVDLENVGMSEVPVSALKQLLALAQNSFRSRCARAYIINAGYFLRSAWYVLSACLDATSRDKVQFLGNDYQDQLANLIGKENLEERFGGDLPNKTEDFFPPDMNGEYDEGKLLYTAQEASALIYQDLVSK